MAPQTVPSDFSLLDLSGNAHRLSAYSGSVVLVCFWATWCPQCIWEMPSLQAITNSFAEEPFIVLAINVGEEKQAAQEFAERYRLTFPVLLDADLDTYKKWPVLGVPASFIIDQQGLIVYTVVGAIEWTNPGTRKKIRDLIALDGGPRTQVSR